MVLGFSKLLGGFMAILEKIASWVGALFSIIPKLFYLLVTFAMQIVDIIQLLFQKLAGLDVYYVEGSDNPETGDFLIYFLRKVLFEKGTLNTVFWSMVILGLFLLVFATIVAVIRTQYNYDDKPVSPTKIVGQAIKSLISFAIVPIVAFFGVYLGNIFLQALNSATTVQATSIEFDSGAGIKLEPYKLADGKKTYSGINLFGYNIGMRNDTFSGMVFRAAAYRANRIRNNADFRALCASRSNETTTGTGIYSGVTFGMFEVTANDYETAAKRLDDAFVFNYRLDQFAYVNWAASTETALTMSVGVLFNDFTAVLYASPYKTFSRYNVAWVWFYYDLWQFDYVMAIISIVSLAIIYLNITSAMMKRAIELTMLMIVSPGVVAITPLDGGAMQKKWRENFIKKTLSAYGAVVGVNLLFIILPFIRNINFFNIPIVDTIVQLLFTIVGLTCIKDFMKLMSDIVGGEDANEAGEKINKQIASTVGKVGAVAASVAMPAAGAMKGLMKNSLGGLVGKGVGKLAKKNSDARNEKKDEDAMLKEMIATGGYKDQVEARRAIENAKNHKQKIKTGAGELTYEEAKNRFSGIRRMKRHTLNPYERERRSYLREEYNKDPNKSWDDLNKKADEYMESQGNAAVEKRKAQRKRMNPLRFMGTLAGQVVDGTYGDKVFDSYKGARNAYEGKATGAFFGAAAKEQKEKDEKAAAKSAQAAEAKRSGELLSATQETNKLLNDLISKIGGGTP